MNHRSKAFRGQSIIETDDIADDVNIQHFCHIHKDVKIGRGTFIGDCTTIRPNSVIGENVSIGTHCKIEGDCSIGDSTRIYSGSLICKQAVVGKRVFMGPHVLLLNTYHPFCSEAKQCVHGPVIEDDVKIGGGAVVCPGLTVGKGSLIGAGCIVVASVPPLSVVAGNPGKVVKHVRDLECKRGRKKNPYEDLL